MNVAARAASSALALLMLIPAAASAQAQQRNPFSDLFGRAPDRTGKAYTAITFRSTAGAKWSQALQQEFTPPDAIMPEGLAGGADAALVADYVRDRVKLLALGRYNYQEYRQDPPFGAPGFDTGVSAELKATTRLVAHGGVNYARSPFYQMMWLPMAPRDLLPADRAAILMMQSDSADATAGITSNYTKRSSLDLSAEARRISFAAVPQNDFASVGGRVRWTRHMSRDLALHAGYGRERMRQQFADGPRDYTNELIDVGVDYSRTFSVARRTSLSFSTETSMLRENNGPRHFRINGDVLLDRRFARTWGAQLGARRATDFLPGFQAPVFTESAFAVIGGHLAKRLMLSISADAGQGEAGFSDPRKYISYGASTRLSVGVTRHFSVFTQYMYYHYQSPADPLTLFLIPRGARQAVSIGVQTWIPLLDKEKVPRDPR